MIDVNDTATKAPTGYELAKARYNDLPDNPSMTSEALYWMVTSLAAELSDEREIVRSQGGRIADLGLRLSSMQGRFAALASAIPPVDESVAHTVEVGTQQPTMRMRLNHAHTKADGWRLSETTVEWSGVGDPDEAAIDKALITAFHLGQREANLRNAPEPADDEDGV
jgi:hypothetical protein